MRRRGRVRRIVGAVVVVLLAAWLIVGYQVIVTPRVDKPSRADAIVLLGPPEANGRLAVAKQLAAQGMASTVLISLNSPKQWQARTYCEHPPAGITVVCFHAEPQTTRGEAEDTRRFVQQHGWRKIIVVTSTYHISRARMIFERCFDGELLMVAADRHIGFFDWVYQYFYQTGAYIKATFQSGC